ncbi:hypothetical protein GOHSU_02_00960 [Gordonia hirsuta DSM 44140 = NBRC 16056]|uniref:DUF1990 domain-containing protein n=1 Tax=Gordonia hirsuta DSM 44140 = NBRC 16056 TaxID=1121927 RepID=L7L7G5_9ACTN|nr:DUF1990 domain-containing protein [Gordonia hirsuta]GAC55953.1 hypothetical protein GOHSU_02_00960 [Gordonia hirsuta DSM 44140 = NBRC 16056]
MKNAGLSLLIPAQARTLAAAPWTYPDVGASARDHLPDGYRSLRRRTELGRGDAAFALAREALLTWQVQLRSGVRVRASAPRIDTGVVAIVGIGLGPLQIGGPVRVVMIDDSPAHVAFSYGTLPGHPEAGEEHFSVTLDDAGAVWFALSGFSRPHSIAARVAAPVAAHVQDRITERYTRSLQD